MLCTSILCGQEEEKYTVVVNLYQPISSEESKLLEEILITQLEFFIENSVEWDGNKIVFAEKPKRMVSKMDELVEEDIRFHDYEALSDFKGFSKTVEKKVQNITDRTYDLSLINGLSKSEIESEWLSHEIRELVSILKTELFVFGEKDVFVNTTEVYPNLTLDEKNRLIKEIEEIKDGDLLTPIELSYKEITTGDDSGMFIGKVGKKDFADKVLDLLAENSQRLERLESELIQLQLNEGGLNGGVSVSKQDFELLNQLPESMNFYFITGSSELSTATLLQLNEIVEILAKAKSINVVITGYADRSGTPELNLRLSKKRAKAVKQFMRESGMSESRFIINYYGESKSESYSNQDRRVEIKFFI